MTLRETLNQFEPRALHNAGLPLEEWRYAQGVYVYGPMNEIPQLKYKVTNAIQDIPIEERKNRYLDFTSGLMMANCGHSFPRWLGTCNADMWQPANLSGVAAACYTPTAERLNAFSALKKVLPPYLDRIVFAVTGSEAVEVAIGIAGATFKLKGDFHGHTAAVRNLSERGRDVFSPPKWARAIIISPYYGPTCEWLSEGFISEMVDWGGTIIVDEIQAGLGRTGTWWGFEHYGIEPDIIVGGKGVAGGLPMSFVAGRQEIMDAPDSIPISTHAGNAVCCCGLANTIAYIRDAGLVENAGVMWSVILEWFISKPRKGLQLNGKGLAMAVVKAGDSTWAKTVIGRAFERHLLLMDTSADAAVKIAPPLCITESQLRDGLAILDECMEMT